MSINKYIGHNSQLCGVEELTLAKGKGKGMTLLNVTNGKGLAFTLSADRAMDISRMSFDGVNMGYFGACGYVSPAYYDKENDGFLKSFTAGFLTTCGLTAVGSPCTDEGEKLGLHGTISNTPSESYMYYETEQDIIIEAVVRDAKVFGDKLLLSRKFTCSKSKNTLKIEDTVKNIGSNKAPCMIMYHFNLGYPLLTENAVVVIPNKSVKPRNAHAGKYIDTALQMEVPQADYEECCYYYDVKIKEGNMASVGIYNPDISKGLNMSFDKSTLDCFTQWKMMGEGEYVLGLEPANCYPDGRDVVRKQGLLKFLEPAGEYKTTVILEFIHCAEDLVK